MSEADADFRILRTCKQIYNEGKHFFSATNQIELWIDLIFFQDWDGDMSVGRKFGRHKLDFEPVRSLRIHLDLYDATFRGKQEIDWTVLQQLIALQS